MRKRLLILSTLVLLAAGASAQQDTLKYRISLRDKAATAYSLERPEQFLSQKAIERRRKQNLAIDSTDLPVCRKYVDEIRRQGVNVIVTGKWENFVTVSCNDSALIDRIAALPFVRTAEKVWTAPKTKGEMMSATRDSVVNTPKIYTDSIYGPAITQIQLSNGDKLHDAGFKGQGMTIAVIDAGFHNLDKITAMQNIRVLGTKDFVNPQADLFAESSHGMSVLSCIGMNRPGIMTGTAPEASFWLLRSEDEYSENLVEQDYWAAAVEFADSVGVDVINTSLGYYAFDDKSKNYKYRDLDGHHALMSRQASRIADKGMVLVCSAGNSGMGSWKKITPPGDAENVLTVGAVNKRALLAPFSSIGNTADNRIKPDVVAVGEGSDVIRTDGNQGKANGTSFSSPIMCGMVACLWQACPKLTAKELIELVRSSGDRADCPDNIYGYGVPDIWKAYNSYKQKK
ncbi:MULTISPECIES: S8 family serine peptidase [Bacteroides]|jgi:subtilisin family serine protease|uniref:S8 family peptidase n=1 Tax=Bacteroides TaxID=816 RepID=UPI000E4370B1|nr:MULTISPECIES: S8 family serine peptidase [Bacteroides]MBS7575527.1 S8 family serine peptidase [Bacteroides propionicigenes]RGM27409.1 serine protease [Bacteroides sp. OM08-17BH]HBO07550.1 serine protease [Bacteroides sp.]